MIWLAWRQFRTQAAVVFGALAVLGVILLVTGLRLRHLYDTSGLASCSGDACDAAGNVFLSHDRLLQASVGKILLLLLPCVTGIFWGAPLVARELESGTFRLAWTQSVTRSRWLTAKIAVAGTASIAATGLLSLMTTWWYAIFDKYSESRFDPPLFDERNIAPLGYAAFAFALGVLAGALIRRTLPAMATTLVGWIGMRFVMITWIRPYLRAPLHLSNALKPPPDTPGPSIRVAERSGNPGDWIVSSKVVDPAGHHVHVIQVDPTDACVQTRTCLAGYHQVLTYQPANRYWPFQIYETAIFFGLAALLIAGCYWWVRRRLS